MAENDFWSGFEHDPRDDRNAGLRASDRDRDRVLDLLGTAYGDGRISRDELYERNEAVTGARALGELPDLVGDLVPRAPARLTSTDLRAEAERRYRIDRRDSLGYLLPAVICWVIWAATGTGFPWPIFVTFGTLLPAARMWLTPEEQITSRQRSLQRKQERRIEKERTKQLPPATPPTTGERSAD